MRLSTTECNVSPDNDQFVVRVERRGSVAVDQPGLHERQLGTPVPRTPRATGCVTVGAVHREIRTHARFDRIRRFIRPHVPRQHVRRRHAVSEISRVAQQGELVAGEAVDRLRAVQLPRRERQRVPALRRVAAHALGSARDVPVLRVRQAAIRDREVEVVAAIAHERRLGLRVVPFVAHAIDAARVAHEHTRLDPLRRRGNAARHFHVEMFHPDHAGRQRPQAILAPRHRADRVGHHEPPPFHRVVAPEREVWRVRQQARGRGEIAHVGEKLRRAQRRGITTAGVVVMSRMIVPVKYDESSTSPLLGSVPKFAGKAEPAMRSTVVTPPGRVSAQMFPET